MLNEGSATQGVPGSICSVRRDFEQTLHCVQGDKLFYKRKSYIYSFLLGEPNTMVGESWSEQLAPAVKRSSVTGVTLTW